MGPGERPLTERGHSPSLLPRLFLQLPLSSSHLNVYSGDPQVTASLVGVTSSSCPADLTQKRELTGTAPLSPRAPPIPAVSPQRLPSPEAPLVQRKPGLQDRSALRRMRFWLRHEEMALEEMVQRLNAVSKRTGRRSRRPQARS